MGNTQVQKNKFVHGLFVLVFILFSSTVTPALLFAAETVTITNSATANSSTGGNNASSGQNGAPGTHGTNGTSGKDGEDGRDGAHIITEGESSASVSITNISGGEEMHTTIKTATTSGVVETATTTVAPSSISSSSSIDDTVPQDGTPLLQKLIGVLETFLQHVGKLF